MPVAAGAVNSGIPPRRIVQVVTSVCTGGLSRYLLDLLAIIDEYNFESHLVCTHFEGPHFAEACAFTKSAAVLKSGNQLAKLKRLLHCFKRLRPDIVHAHQEPIALIAARLAGVPVRLETIHLADYWTCDARAPVRFLAARCATNHVVYSQHEREIVVAHTDPDKVVVINPGLNTDRWTGYFTRSDMPSGVSLPQDAFVIGTIARLDPQKGVCHLINALPSILKQCPTARLFIVGDGALRADLEQQCSLLGVSDRVVFAGFQLDAYRFLGAMDVFVMPSLFESWGFTAVEAMGAGLPVISSDIPGPREFITNEQTGLLVNAANPDAISDAVIRLRTNSELRRKIAEAGREHVRARHSVRAMVQEYARLYARSAAA